MSHRSDQVANWLRRQGVRRTDRVIVMLGNQVELWESLLATMKLGAVVIPATTLLGTSDLVDRVQRGAARHVVAGAGHAEKFAEVPGDYTRIASASRSRAGRLTRRVRRRGAVRSTPARRRRPAAAVLHVRHHRRAEARRAHPRVLPGRSSVHDVLARAAPRRRAPEHLVAGLGEARVENVFAPWNAEATVLVYNYARFDAAELLSVAHGAGHHVLRAADGLADAGPSRPRPAGPATAA